MESGGCHLCAVCGVFSNLLAKYLQILRYSWFPILVTRQESLKWTIVHRVNGDLAVSRSIGDIDFKLDACNHAQWNFPDGIKHAFTNDLVISEPDVQV